MNAAGWISAIALSAVLAASAPALAADTPPDAPKPPRQVEITGPGEGEDRLQLVGQKMRESQALIAAADRDPRMQDVQKDIVADLDWLIAQARKTAVRSGEKDPTKNTSRTPLGSVPKPGGEGTKPGETPGAKSGERNTSTPGKEDDAARALAGMKRVWGTLPPREREKVLELKAEDFVPKYRAMIEEYYRRLAAGGGGGGRREKGDRGREKGDDWTLLLKSEISKSQITKSDNPKSEITHLQIALPTTH